jgi:hypothetical protein
VNIPAEQFANRARLKAGSRQWNHYTKVEQERKEKFLPYDRLQGAMKGWR